MRKVKEILRLRWGLGLGVRQIARSCSVSHSTVSEVLARAETAGLSWPLPEDLDEATLEAKLYPAPSQTKNGKPLPDMEYIHKELRRKGVTLQLLWEEYKQAHPDGYQRSQFCQLYRDWAKTIDMSMRQIHIAGEKMFVDYAGQKVPVIELSTGEVREASVFIAVLGASNYTYAEPTWDQTLEAWISAHVRAFEFFGGVPRVIVPDNLKSGVKQPDYYEPDINLTYQEMAVHYNAVVLPARVRKPKDKAKVEEAVQNSERRILARLRNRTFFGLAELREAIQEALEDLNNRPFQKMDGCRRSLFLSLDKPALQPLPGTRYEFALWKKARANVDYHVEVDHNYYSVPYQLARQEVEVRLTASTVEVLFKGKRMASHRRLYGKGQYSTLKDHMPDSHRRYLEWSPSRIVRWAESIGPNTAKVAETILAQKPHPEQGFRSCLGMFRLAKEYGNDRVEAACGRAVALGAYSYRSVQSILKRNLDQAKAEAPVEVVTVEHENVRGAGYYIQGDDQSC
ncbi:MAG: IS21 family transposase [Bacillota bacterium]